MSQFLHRMVASGKAADTKPRSKSTPPKSPAWKVGVFRTAPLHELPPPELPASVAWLKNPAVKDASQTGFRKI